MTQEELKRQQELLEQAAKAKKDAIDFSANEEITNIEQEHTANVKDIDAQYNDIIDISNVQKLINEKQVSEAMANAGLSDSGLNRTQQTAIQLSHSNAVSEAKIARQKSVDALALAMRQKISSIKSNQEASKANVDSELAEGNQKLIETYQKQGDTAYTAKNDLITSLNNPEKTTNEKTGLLYNYVGQYGADDTLNNYAKSYFSELMADDKATKESKKTAAKMYANAFGVYAVDELVKNQQFDVVENMITEASQEADITGDQTKLNAIFNKVESHGYEWNDEKQGLKLKLTDEGAIQARPGISKEHITGGEGNLTDEIKGELANAFRKNGMPGYIATVNNYKAKYSPKEMDEYMLKTFGHFWLMATGTEDAKKAGYAGGGFKLGKNVGSNVFGLDANAEVIFDEEFEGATSRTIGELRSLALDLDVDRAVMRHTLEQYGGRNIFGEMRTFTGKLIGTEEQE